MKSFPPVICAGLALVLTLIGHHTSWAGALNPTVIKLHAKNAEPQSQPFFGSSAAHNQRWVVIGERGHDQPDNAGAVHVFDAVSGRHLRVLRSPQPVTNGGFGSSVAVDGDLALIGESNGLGAVANSGAAHLYDLPTGRLLRSFMAAGGASGDNFGYSVALSGSVAAVGAPSATDTLPDQGVVYFFDPASGAALGTATGTDTGSGLGVSLAVSDQIVVSGAIGEDGVAVECGVVYVLDGRTGALLRKLQASDGTTDAAFGVSVAINGKRVLVGAELGNNLVNLETGAAYLFDAHTGALIFKLNAPDWSASDYFGQSVALEGNVAVVGAPSHNGERGAVSVFSTLTGQLQQQFNAPDAKMGARLGAAISMSGGVLLAGANNDGVFGAGAAYLIKPLTGLASFFKHAGVGDSVPGATIERYTRLGDPVMNDENETMFGAQLSGAGAGNAGVWHNLNAQKSLALALRKGVVDAGATLRGFGQPILNDPDYGVVETALAGAPGFAGGARGIYCLSGIESALMVRFGDMPVAGGGRLNGFSQLTQSATTGRAGLAYRFARSPGLINAANDTGVLTLFNDGSTGSSLREGAASPTGEPFGQFNRLAFPFGHLAFAASLQSAPATNQGVFAGMPGAMPALIARRGQMAAGGNGAAFRSFLGETVSHSGRVLLRAALSGQEVRAANATGLWSDHSGSLQKVARAGDAVPGLPGVVWAGFTRFWTGDFGVNKQLLFLARLRGVGVTAANDQVLCLVREDGGLVLLLREGDAVPDHSGARLRNIQSVVYRPDTGLYLVLASLAGASPAANQALFAGNTRAMPMAVPLRRPYLVMRKGGAFKSLLGGAASVNGIRIGSSYFDATGAGHKGLGSPINSFNVAAITLTYSDRSVEMARGLP